MQDTNEGTKEICNALKKHIIEFVIAAHGASVWQCVRCGEYFDEMEDSQP